MKDNRTELQKVKSEIELKENELEKYEKKLVQLKNQEKKIRKQASFEEEIKNLNHQSKRIKDEYEQINHIKYAVRTVNEDYGIDLSIEIDKAIKRGEQPSVIAQIKKYQEQQEAYEKRKEKTKDYYRNEER